MRVLKMLALCMLVLAGSSVLAAEETVLVVEIARHGARVPIYNIGNVSWVKGLGKGELTPVGNRQHFLLGKEMANRYPNLLQQDLLGSEYYVRSSNFQRTTTSAISHLMGMWSHFDPAQLLFQNGDDRIQPPWVFTSVPTNMKTGTPFGFTPDPVHVETTDEDDTLYLLNSNQCPVGKKASQDFYAKLRDDCEKNQNFKNMVDDYAKKYNVKVSSLGGYYEACVSLGDFALQDFRNNPTPVITDKDEIAKIGRCYEASIVGRFTDQSIARIVVSNLMEDILTKMNRKVEVSSDPMKYYLFTAHDSTLAPILVQAGILNARCFVDDMKNAKLTPSCTNFPDVASNIVFELINDYDDYFVRMLYNFEPVDICGLKNTNEKFRCPIDAFNRKWRSLTESNWKSYCGTPSRIISFFKDTDNPWRPWAIVLIAVSSLFLLFITGICVGICYLRKKHAPKGSDYMSAVEVENISKY